MRGKQAQHADPSLHPLYEQQVVPFQFHGWHGQLVQDFPVFFPDREEILYEVSCREIVLIPVAEHGTLLVFLSRGYDPFHGPLPDLTAQAVLFTSDPQEQMALRVSAADALSAFEQIWASFSLPSSEGEPDSPPQARAVQGMLHGNVYYRMQGWIGWCTIFFPTGTDRALLALMVYSGEGAQYSARVVRFSPENAWLRQAVLQAPTPEGALARTLYRYRLGTIARLLFSRALRWQPPSWLVRMLRLVGGIVGILLVLCFQLAAAGFIMGMLGKPAPPGTAIASVSLLLFGLFGPCIVLLPVPWPRLVTGPPGHRAKRLHRALIGLLLAGEYSSFLYAAIGSGHFWDASLIVAAGFFLWLTLTPVYAGAGIGRMFHGGGPHQPPREGAEAQ
jgi:hypothetical protein